MGRKSLDEMKKEQAKKKEREKKARWRDGKREREREEKEVSVSMSCHTNHLFQGEASDVPSAVNPAGEPTTAESTVSSVHSTAGSSCKSVEPLTPLSNVSET